MLHGGTVYTLLVGKIVRIRDCDTAIASTNNDNWTPHTSKNRAPLDWDKKT